MSSDIDIASLLDDPEPKHRPPPPEPEAAESDRLWTWEHLIVLTAITLLAGLLRLYRIGEWSFWIDEIHTLRDAILKSNEEFWSTPTSRYPIGFLLLRWMQPLLPGSGEGSWRLLFAFSGICSVPMLAVFLRRLLGAGPALLAALLLAISPWHLFWSQNCRFYTLVLLFALGAMGAFHVGVEKGSRLWLATSIVLAALAALTHPSSAGLMAAFIVYVLVLRTRWVRWPEKLNRRVLVWFLIPVLIGSAVLGLVAFQAFERYQTAGKADISIFHLANTMVFFTRVPILLAAAGGIVLLWQRSRRTTAFLVTMIVVPGLTVAASSFQVKATAQYLFFTLPLWCALAAFAVWEVTERTSLAGVARLGARAFVFGILILDFAAEDHMYFHYRHGDRPKWRHAASYIEKHGSPEDIVASSNEPSMEWYLNTVNPLRPVRTASGGHRKVVQVLASWTHQDLETWRKSADENGHRVWVVLEEPTLHLNDPSKFWDRWLRKNFHQVLRLPNWVGPKDMTILIYRYDPAPKKAAKDVGKTG